MAPVSLVPNPEDVLPALRRIDERLRENEQDVAGLQYLAEQMREVRAELKEVRADFKGLKGAYLWASGAMAGLGLAAPWILKGLGLA